MCIAMHDYEYPASARKTLCTGLHDTNMRASRADASDDRDDESEPSAATRAGPTWGWGAGPPH